MIVLLYVLPPSAASSNKEAVAPESMQKGASFATRKLKALLFYLFLSCGLK